MIGFKCEFRGERVTYMTKLTQVRKALKKNLKIKIVHEEDWNCLPYRSGPDDAGGPSQILDFYTALKSGAIEAVEDLQTLMMSLIPDLKSTSKIDFRDLGHKIGFGSLQFVEKIATETIRREVILTDKEVVPSGGLIDDKHETKTVRQLERLILVRVFPNIQIATDALHSENLRHGIYKTKLAEKYGLTKLLTEWHRAGKKRRGTDAPVHEDNDTTPRYAYPGGVISYTDSTRP